MSDSDGFPPAYSRGGFQSHYIKKELRLHILTLISAIHFKQKRMRKAGLEPARYCYHTAPEAVRVCQFRHFRILFAASNFLRRMREMGLEPTRRCQH